jgi:tRNA-modifying protein YgfZ
MRPLVLSKRGLVEIEGPDAAGFLDRILTIDVSTLAPGRAGYGALLAPQGKILAEMIILRADTTRFLADVAKDALPAFLQRLNLMKLRADLRLRDCSQDVQIAIGQGGEIDFEDPRPWPEGSHERFRTILPAGVALFDETGRDRRA